MFPTCGHQPQEELPEEFVGAVADWLRRRVTRWWLDNRVRGASEAVRQSCLIWFISDPNVDL